MSDKMEFKSKKVWDKDCMLREFRYKMNNYTPNNRPAKCMKGKLTESKGEIDDL